jgi:hypothetical protein
MSVSASMAIRIDTNGDCIVRRAKKNRIDLRSPRDPARLSRCSSSGIAAAKVRGGGNKSCHLRVPRSPVCTMRASAKQVGLSPPYASTRAL